MLLNGGKFAGHRYLSSKATTFHRSRRRPVLAVGLIFFLSGLLHEGVLNLTLWLVTGRNLFGTMMAYYLLQGAGVLLGRRLFKGREELNRLFTCSLCSSLCPSPST